MLTWMFTWMLTWMLTCFLSRCVLNCFSLPPQRLPLVYRGIGPGFRLIAPPLLVICTNVNATLEFAGIVPDVATNAVR